MLEKLLDYAITQGPWAVMCLALGYAFFRTRKEAKIGIKELNDLVAEKEAEIRAIEDARRKEALDLQSKGFENIGKLVSLMDKVGDALVKDQGSREECARFHGRIKALLDKE